MNEDFLSRLDVYLQGSSFALRVNVFPFFLDFTVVTGVVKDSIKHDKLTRGHMNFLSLNACVSP